MAATGSPSSRTTVRRTIPDRAAGGALPVAARSGMMRLASWRGEPVGGHRGVVAGGGGMLYRTAAVPGPVLRGPGIVAIVATVRTC